MEDTFSLLRRYRAGDSHALELLFERHYPRVERIVRVRRRSSIQRRVDVVDVVQAVMLRALEGLDGFEIREDARLIDWLARIAEHEVAGRLALEHAQKRDPRREVALDEHAPDDEAGRHGSQIASESTMVPDRVAQREISVIVDECLAGLDEELRDDILLREYAGGSWPFVAESLGRASPGAARQLYLRAREALSESVRRRI